MVGIIVLMAWLMTRESDKEREIIVIDDSGMVAPHLVNEGSIRYRMADRTLEQMQEQAPEGAFGILVIGHDIMSNPKAAQLFTYESSTLMIEESISGQIRKIVEDAKLKTYDIDNLDEILAEVQTPIKLQTKEITDSGETRDSSSALNMAAAYIFGLLIYMFVFMYGTMVMQGSHRGEEQQGARADGIVRQTFPAHDGQNTRHRLRSPHATIDLGGIHRSRGRRGDKLFRGGMRWPPRPP